MRGAGCALKRYDRPRSRGMVEGGRRGGGGKGKQVKKQAKGGGVGNEPTNGSKLSGCREEDRWRVHMQLW